LKANLYFAIETETESNIKISLQFGPDNVKKIAAVEDEKRIRRAVHKEIEKEKLNGKQSAREKIMQEGTSKNPAEQQKAIRMQIEDLINHQKKA